MFRAEASVNEGLAQGISQLGQGLAKGIENYHQEDLRIQKENDLADLLHNFNINKWQDIGASATGKNADAALTLMRIGMANEQLNLEKTKDNLAIQRDQNEQDLYKKHGWDLLEAMGQALGQVTTGGGTVTTKVPNVSFGPGASAFGMNIPSINIGTKEVTTETPGTVLFDPQKEIAAAREKFKDFPLNKQAIAEFSDLLQRGYVAATTEAGRRAKAAGSDKLAAEQAKFGYYDDSGVFHPGYQTGAKKYLQDDTQAAQLALEDERQKNALERIDKTGAQRLDIAKAQIDAAGSRQDKAIANRKAISDEMVALRGNLAAAKTQAEIDRAKKATFKTFYTLIQKAQSVSVDKFGDRQPGLPPGAAYWQVLGGLDPEVVSNYSLAQQDEYAFYTYLIRRYMSNVSDPGKIDTGVLPKEVTTAIETLKSKTASSDPDIAAFAKALKGASLDRFKKFLTEADAMEDGRLSEFTK